uniref:Uncharacterized protein n=1 Tax=Oryza sativa subsp. japonica TaxID=39947 RepID=Q5Z735_ORYSJ|nr:hypothetical protein [Oryza sativa Japonica Group]
MRAAPPPPLPPPATRAQLLPLHGHGRRPVESDMARQGMRGRVTFVPWASSGAPDGAASWCWRIHWRRRDRLESGRRLSWRVEGPKQRGGDRATGRQAGEVTSLVASAWRLDRERDEGLGSFWAFLFVIWPMGLKYYELQSLPHAADHRQLPHPCGGVPGRLGLINGTSDRAAT